MIQDAPFGAHAAQSYHAWESALNHKIRIVIVCLWSSVHSLNNLLDREVPRSSALAVRLLTIPDQWRHEKADVQNRVRSHILKCSGVIHLITVDDFKHDSIPKFKSNDLVTVVSHIQLTSASLSKLLNQLLVSLSIDWITQIQRTLNRWRFGLTPDSLRAWRDQFHQLGNFGWIGDGILKAIDFWPEERLLDSLDLSKEILDGYTTVCVNNRDIGGSAGSIAGMITKHLGTLGHSEKRLEDFSATLLAPRADDTGGRLLFIEDGVFTGTEMIDLINDILTSNATDPSLGNTSTLQISTFGITMLFPVSTTLGCERLRRYLLERGLHNIQVLCAPAGVIEVLTPEGKRALEKGQFWDASLTNSAVDPDKHLLRSAFSGEVWKSKGDAIRAMSFCKRIGGQLMQAYAKRRNLSWNGEQVRRAALGMHGMGLTIAFSHSVPLCTLPLLWAEGSVSNYSKSILWKPLFSNAQKWAS